MITKSSKTNIVKNMITYYHICNGFDEVDVELLDNEYIKLFNTKLAVRSQFPYLRIDDKFSIKWNGELFENRLIKYE